jgi:hypothetical protein
MKTSRILTRGRRAVAIAMAVAVGIFTSGADGRANANKWKPYADLLVRPTTNPNAIGEAHLFLPLWQNNDSLAFMDLRGLGDDDLTGEGNFGLGFRTMHGENWILGGYGFFDLHHSDRFDEEQDFIGGMIGIEAMSEDLDFNLNGYIPESDTGSLPSRSKVDMGSAGLSIERGAERALPGFDAEFGARLPLFGNDSMFWDTRAYVGGFYFDAPSFDSVAGPSGRVEMRLHDIPFLPEGSRFVVGGDVQWDRDRGTVGRGLVSMRIAFGESSGGSGPDGRLSKLERRMVDPIRRRAMTTRAGQKGSEVALNPATSAPITTVMFAEEVGDGPGDFDNPDSLDDAIANAGDDQIIVALGNTGDIDIAAIGTAMLTDGQILMGGGARVLVLGANSGQLVAFKAPGTRGTLADPTNTVDLLDLASNNTISGLDFSGGSQSIFGDDIGNLTVRDSMFMGFSDDGIDLSPDGTSGMFHAFRNTFVVTGSDGIDIATANGGQIEFTISDNRFEIEGDSGIDIEPDDTSGNHSAMGIIVGNTFMGADTGDGVFMNSLTNGSGIDVQIANNLFENLNAGVEIDADDTGTLVASISGNRFIDSDEGIHLDVEDHDDGDIFVTLDVTDNEFRGNSAPFFMDVNDADSDGDFEVQIVTNIVGNRFISNPGDAVSFVFDSDSDADDGGFFVTTLIQDNRFQNNLGDAVNVDVSDWDDASLTMSYTIIGNKFLDNTGSGIHMDVSDIDLDSDVVHLITEIRDNVFQNNAVDAIWIEIDDEVDLDAEIFDNSIFGTTGDGIHIDAFPDEPSFISIGGNTIKNVGGTGILLDVDDTTFSSEDGGVKKDNTVTGAGTTTDFSGSGNSGSISVNGADLTVP